MPIDAANSSMTLQVTIVSVDRNKELRPTRLIINRSSSWLAVSAHMDQPGGAVVVDHLARRAAPGGRSRGRSTSHCRESRASSAAPYRLRRSCANLWLFTAARLSALIGSPCVPRDHDAELVRWKSLIWPGLMISPGGRLEVAQVLRDLGRVVQRPSDDRDLASMLGASSIARRIR